MAGSGGGGGLPATKLDSDNANANDPKPYTNDVYRSYSLMDVAFWDFGSKRQEGSSWWSKFTTGGRSATQAVFFSGATRCRAHLTGSSCFGVKPCEKVPSVIKEELLKVDKIKEDKERKKKSLALLAASIRSKSVSGASGSQSTRGT
ncbi:hypothetical protein FOA52_011389 [Chlamydomonas sp. UWO 241]|nr:hypothetical protein FOA52_011389 [Chlamydomonas sp. UWO 241]